jgi:hypothetical protein
VNDKSMSNIAALDSPLRAVLQSFEAGATSVADITQDTGLSLDLVRAVMDQLIAMGKLRATALSSGCPVAAPDCGACASASADGAACQPEPKQARGPVLIELNTKTTSDS